MSKAFWKVLAAEGMRILTAPLRLLPIKKNRILFTGLTGGNSYDYSCNPKYIYEYLKQHEQGQYEYVWAVSDPGRFSFLTREGVKLVKHFSPASFPYLLTAKVIVTNGSYAPWFAFRKKQYVINTWHGGGAYKNVENETPRADWATKQRARFCAGNIDLFLASCRTQENEMIRTTYQYKGEVLRAGTPRNDMLVKGDTQQAADRVREHFAIPKEGRIVLFAPTYRNLRSQAHLDGDALLKELEKSGEKWYLISRYHRYQNESSNVRITGERILQGADYPDMQELLCAADVMITDYSSCVWDYGFLKRPCLLYVPDKAEYTEKNGFYVELDRWPYPQADTMEKLLEELSLLLTDPESMAAYRQRIEEHMKELGSYETGEAAAAVAEKIKEQTNG